MTLVCVRMEESFGVSRITALADTRASIRRDDGSFKTVSDTTTKLFAVPVRCYRIESLSPVVGAWLDPYFETQIGLGFSGSCFEALTVIAHISQSLSALVAPKGDEPLPTRNGLVNLIAKHCETYFGGHSGDGKPILFLLAFGFEDGKPWVAKFTASREDGIKSDAVWADKNTLVTIGQDRLFQKYAGDWRDRIQKHQGQVSARKASSTADGAFEKSLEVARHDVAERKLTEQEMLRQIESEFAESIGGVLQRLELSIYDGQVVSGFTCDDRPYMHGTSCNVTQGTFLGPVPITEKMGRKAREPDTLVSEV
ncbi:MULTISPECIES: hypothetical protein [Mesorhizobium]|uniref:hypothetical protein n=1 Tax=Mesorhizobium TaxID=68287 RepID=UPI000802384E|nr:MULTISPECIES: hypothetical protein [Mesorhizobium]MUT27049.1 hypothetical protein [Mesorhizobium japonicum]OBQ74042.1 hypothetical protein A9K71_13070 [Mesorhizobium sp. WSM3873]